jgi:riboflavin kinase / FMN adenylyltransferase
MLGEAMRFEAIAVPSVSVGGETVSSTAIRGAIQAGDLENAAAMLGRNFSVFGTVQPGRQLARQLGFPTANVRPECEQLPPDGVYVVDIEVDGETWAGIANVGLRPTVEKDARERLVEAHLFNWTGELGGRDVEITFREFLRREERFPSVDALRAQIAADAAIAREVIAARGS